MRYTLLELIHCLALGMLFINSLYRVEMIQIAEKSGAGMELMKQIILFCIAIAGIWFLSRNLYEIHEARIVQKMWDEVDEDNEK